MAEVSTAIRDVENIIAQLDDKVDSPSQPSPGSNSSASTADSGLAHDNHNKEAKKVERRSSRLSTAGVSPVLEQLEQLIISDEWIRDDVSTAGSHHSVSRKSSRDTGRLSDIGRTLVTSASLKSYIDLLGSQHRQSIAAWLYGNTSNMLSSFLRFPDASVHCSETEANLNQSVRNGIGHAVKLALKSTYPEYSSKGWRCFVEQGAPIVYVSPALHMDVSSFLASEFGITDVVVLDKMDGELAEVEGRIDHAAFERRVVADVEAGKQPVMVIGVVGSTVLGQNDMISKLLETRKNKAKFWLHIVGQAIAALSLREPTEVLVHVLSQVDSMTLPLAQWLGIPAAPVVTVHRAVEGHKVSYRERLDTLPWWVASQQMTQKKMVDAVENAYYLSKIMLRGLASLPQIEIVGMENAADFANRVYKNQYNAPTVLVFKYKYAALKEAAEAHKAVLAVAEESREEGSVATAEKKLAEEGEYSDSVNSWLAQGLLSECQSLGIHMIELAGVHGTAFRFCPLEHSAALGSTVEQVQRFIGQLGDVLKIVDSTVQARSQLDTIKAEFSSLVVLPIRKWAGVGSVCYIPTIVKETTPSEWNDNQKQQISHLNLELVHSLRAVDSAFSSGESARYGVNCVKFGMLSDAKDLVDLVKMVAERGKEIENSQQYLDSLAELIRQGIEAANEDLRKENDQRLQNEGVIRQLPLMGSLVNWWSPLSHDQHNIRGRSFNLKTGEIQATDVLYKQKNGHAEPMTPIETPQVPHTFEKTDTIEEEKEKEDVATPVEPVAAEEQKKEEEKAE